MNTDFLHALKKLYGLQNPTIIELAKGGYAAESFVIEDRGSKFFVKKYQAKRTKERLLEMHTVKEFFNKNGVPTITPLLNTSGHTLSEVDGRYFSIFPYVPDRLYNTLPNLKAAASAGENLAKLHMASTGHLALVDKTLAPWNKILFLKNAAHMLELAEAGATSYDAVAAEMLKLKVSLAESSELIYEDLNLKNDAILHGDYLTQNLFFDATDTVSYTFDFERTVIGPRTTDLAYGIFMICFDFNTEDEDCVSELHFKKARAFIKAYNQTFPIDEGDFLNGLRWFFWSQMVYIEWPLRGHYFGGDDRADGLLSKRLNRLKYFSLNWEQTLDSFRKFYISSSVNQ